jgi:hypothetical protein
MSIDGCGDCFGKVSLATKNGAGINALAVVNNERDGGKSRIVNARSDAMRGQPLHCLTFFLLSPIVLHSQMKYGVDPWQSAALGNNGKRREQ